MSKNFAVLSKTPPGSSIASFWTRLPGRPREYTELIQYLFHGSSVVALIGTGAGDAFSAVCDGIAYELSSQGKRVVLVSVPRLIAMKPSPPPPETDLTQEPVRTVSVWPSFIGPRGEVPESPNTAVEGSWLDALRRNFDSVLLACPSLEATPEGAAIACKADAAVLAVEAGRTSKDRVLRDQQTLQSRGVSLAGCILINAR
jgi:Mrp family chromosome partitioning ATPase